MRHADHDRRRSRAGKGLLPPNSQQWAFEHNGLDLRDELGIDTSVVLDHLAAFQLLPNATVQPHGAIPAAEVFLNQFRGANSGAWSGMAIRLPDGYEAIYYNDSHALNRVRATLMEEFYHIYLDHERSELRVYSEDGRWRSFNSTTEKEAYHSGAAALVPYRSLKKMVDDGVPLHRIANHFGVSRDLVQFRAKVTRCFKALHRRKR